MSHQLINLNIDLKKLRDEGYEVEIISNLLVIRNVPYVNSNQEIKYGHIISELSLAGNKTVKPSTHVVNFVGEHPCNKDGSLMTKLVNASKETVHAEGLTSQHSFSSKPKTGYIDYHHKMSQYALILSSPAESINPAVTPKTFKVIKTKNDESVFNYCDTASSRAQINIVTKKLEIGKVLIIGLGGTGSYVLDLVAKTPVKEIHIYDGDVFLSHNAFRSPGAASIEELEVQSKKVDYLQRIYSKMHKNIVPHDYNIDKTNIDELQGFDFVFICMDKGSSKQVIIEKLWELGISFIDVGMGVQLVDDKLCGILRTTCSTKAKQDHIKGTISFSDDNGDNEYSNNIQIAELNAFNAANAVIKWKKLYGFYSDLENEHSSLYTIDGNHLLNGAQL